MPAPEPPPQVESAEALLCKQLGKLLTIEETLARTVLPKLQLEAQDQQLQQTFADHLAADPRPRRQRPHGVRRARRLRERR